MKSLFCSIAALCLVWALPASTLMGQKKLQYPLHEIPAELLENSNVVIREDVSRYEIYHLGKGKHYAKMVMTILNKKGDRFAEVRIGYDKLNKIVSLKGQRYDRNGRLISQLKNKDIHDFSSYDGFSIYTDNRIKYFDLRYAEYPYTIVYEYEIEENGFMSLSNWIPFGGFNISSEKSSLSIITPEDYDIKYLELNIEPCAKEEIVDGKKITSWQFGQYPALKRESNMPHLQSVLPQIITAPTNFQLEGYQGSMADWASLGKWEYELNIGRDALPDFYVEKVKELVADEPSRTGKIKLLYDHLQANTRYISIQLGIGGWQTFPAAHVAENGYGDCKALTNFMKSMLKTVDIESYYTLVRAGRNSPDIIKDFPSNQFNHMILCVPNYNDTIWLECTSQDNPFGYLGDFTGDRDVLVINENGGRITHTKAFSKEENIQVQTSKIALHPDGQADIALSVTCSGLQYDNYARLIDIGEKEQHKWLFKNLDISGFHIDDLKLERKVQQNPELNMQIDVHVPRFASVSGKRIFIEPNVFNQSGELSRLREERKYDFVLRLPYTDVDTVRLQVPQGYHVEFIPKKTTIEAEFGSYQSDIISEEGIIKYIRKATRNSGTFPASSYEDYVDFVNKIAEADKAKIVLVKTS